MRYRATANIIWDFDTQLNHDGAFEIANKHLGNISSQDGMSDLRLVLRLDKLKEKVEKVKLGEFAIDEVMPFVNKDESKKEYDCNGIKYYVKMNSHRYFIFRECMKCVACELPGTRMLLECHPADKSPHFNLYGEEDGKLILMTKDHIYAKAFGGEDRHSNYQTMCLTCNNLKGHSNLTLEGVRELRRIYNENKGKVTKKQLHLLIENAKMNMSQPWPTAKVTVTQRKTRLAKMKATSDVITTACDINVYQDKDEFYGKSVYDNINSNHRHVGCIKKDTCLEPLIATKGQVMCSLYTNEENPLEAIVIILQESLLKTKD